MANYLSDRRIALGITQKEVAENVGVTEATVSRWESGNIANMKRDKIYALSKILKCSPYYIMTGEAGDGMIFPGNIASMPAVHKIPRIGTIACGTPILAEQNIECYDVVPEFVHADFTLVCQGDSMINARIFDGDIVCIRRQKEVENGDIAAVLIDDEATLKRFRKYPDRIILEAENPSPPNSTSPGGIETPGFFLIYQWVQRFRQSHYVGIFG